MLCHVFMVIRQIYALARDDAKVGSSVVCSAVLNIITIAVAVLAGGVNWWLVSQHECTVMDVNCDTQHADVRFNEVIAAVLLWTTAYGGTSPS